MSEAKKKMGVGAIIGMSIGLAVVVFLLVIVSALAVDKFVKKSPVPACFGISMLVVQTGSMSGTIESGDIVVVKRVSKFNEGDIITFMPEGDTIPTTHRIVRIEGDNYYTKGDANNAEDMRPITAERIAGKVVKTIPKVGLFFRWIADEGGWLYLVAILAVIVIGILLLKIYGSDNTDKKGKGA